MRAATHLRRLPPWVWLAAGLIVELGIFITDIALGENHRIATGLLLGPLLVAVRQPPRVTAVVGGLSVTLGIVASIVDGHVRSADHLLPPLFIAIGSVLAVYSADVRLRAEARAAAEERLAFIGRADSLLGASLDYRQVLQQIVGMTVPQLADYAIVDVIGEAHRVERVAVGHRNPERVQQIFDQYNGNPIHIDDEGIIPRVLRTGQALLMTDVDEDWLSRTARGPEHQQFLKQIGVRSSAFVALEARGRVIGALQLIQAESDRRFGPEDLELARDLASRCSMAIDNAILYAEARDAEARERFLAEASEVFDASLDADQVVEAIAKLLVRDMCDQCLVALINNVGETTSAAHAGHTDADEQGLDALEHATPLAIRRSRIATAMRAGETTIIDLPISYPERFSEEPELYAAYTALGMRTIFVVALSARGNHIGSIALGRREVLTNREERDGLLELFADVGRRAALAVDNARLYTERSRIARTLQNSLLPTDLPEIPGVNVAARFRPAGDGSEIGGDFYDCFPIGNGDWAITVGDVCGKGADAAAVTALARYTLRASLLHERRPSVVLAMLNEALLRQRRDFRFATVAFVSLRPRSDGTIDGLFATGGHPLPYLVRASGEVEELGEPGTLLGIIDVPELSETEFTLGPGDAIVLYTDGVTEASPVDDAFGPEHFAKFLGEHAALDAPALAESIEDAVLAIQGGRPRDDVAVVIARAVIGAGTSST